jgi:subtilisin family serine protease
MRASSGVWVLIITGFVACSDGSQLSSKSDVLATEGAGVTLATLQHSSTAYVANEVIVRFTSDVTEVQATRLLSSDRYRVEERLMKSLNLYLVRILSSVEVLDAIQEIQTSPFVVYAQPNHWLQVRKAPNDTEYFRQWHLENTGDNVVKSKSEGTCGGGCAASAGCYCDLCDKYPLTCCWDACASCGDCGYTPGIDVNAELGWLYGTDSSSVVIAFIDGGYEPFHPDLYDNIWKNAIDNTINGVDEDGNGYTDDVRGWDVGAQSGVIPDGTGHGTKVAGVAGAVGDNNKGVAGVSWAAQMLLVAWGDDTSTSTGIAIKAIDYVVTQRTLWDSSGGTQGAHIVVVNGSFGTSYSDCSSSLYTVWNDLLDELGSLGILYVGATSNEKVNVDTEYDVPSGCTSEFLVSVTDVDREGKVASGYGKNAIDIAAPGQDIFTTAVATVDNQFAQYEFFSGTSAATPQVAAAIALMHANAKACFQEYAVKNPPGASKYIKSVLLDSVNTSISDYYLTDQTVSGGRLNLSAALSEMKYGTGCGNGCAEPLETMANCPTDVLGTQSCCVGHTSPGCTNSAVQACVCAKDSSCCSWQWTATCALLAEGCGYCTGDCCAANDSPGCNTTATPCESCVCAQYSFCCSDKGSWNSICAGIAQQECASSCPDCDSCGNGTCGPQETTTNCFADCGSQCGDGQCNGGETTCSCVQDCAAACGDGCCNGNESCTNCSTDCGCTAPEFCGGGGTANQCGCTAVTCQDAGYGCGTATDFCGGTVYCGGCILPKTCGGGGAANQCGCTSSVSCQALGMTCGTLPDGCGGTLYCGTCVAPETCGGGGAANQCGCTKTSCQALGLNCGSISDGCGGTLECGTCVAPSTCGGGGMANQCGCTLATSCQTLGLNCGSVPDGCGGTQHCGTCAAPETCGGGGTANQCGCTPTSCQTLGLECGTMADGCGGTLSCGTCVAPESCGGGGTANQCGCTAASCQSLGFNCGTASDGCGGTLTCGTCVAPASCGGGGTANQCGCTPTSCQALGFECGSVSNGCGGTLDCGSCVAPSTCGGGGTTNQCGCTPASCQSLGFNCGTTPDGCGGTLTCGTCVAPASCGGGGTTNHCGCANMTSCSTLGFDCGSAPDGCGGTLACGDCSALESCGGGGVANQCGCTPITCQEQGFDCGLINDDCGGSLHCGTCTAPETCGGGGTANRCGCMPTSCELQGWDCGSVADECGGSLHCGSCKLPENCGGGGVANQCGCAPTTKTICVDGGLAIQDACGGVGETVEVCGDRGCSDAGCCPEGTTSVDGVCASDAPVVADEPDVVEAPDVSSADAGTVPGKTRSSGCRTGQGGSSPLSLPLVLVMAALAWIFRSAPSAPNRPNSDSRGNVVA